MKGSKITLIILVFCLIISACRKKDYELEEWNMNGKWEKRLCEQPPIVLFDYQMKDSKRPSSFDFILYKLDLGNKTKEYICELPYNKDDSGLSYNADKTYITYSRLGATGIVEVNLKNGNTNFIKMKEAVSAPKYLNEKTMSYISDQKLYTCDENYNREIIVENCEQSFRGWETYAWLCNGQKLIYVTKNNDDRYELIELDLNTDASKTLLEMDENIGFIISYNEKTLLVKCNKEIFFYDMNLHISTKTDAFGEYIYNIYSPCFSPDNNLLAFVRLHDDGSYLNTYEIWLMDIKTKEKIIIYKKMKSSIAAIIW